MKERKLTISIVWANIFSIGFFAIIAIPTIILWNIMWGSTGFFPFHKGMSYEEVNTALTGSMIRTAIFVVAMIVGIVVHELIHGITWAHYAKGGLKTISFGIMWKMLTPYCHCNEPLKVRSYIIGALMPLIVVGILPWVIGLLLHSILVTALGVIFIVSASGDILVVWKLRNEKSTSTVLDHPTEAGCIIYDKE